MQQQQRQLGAQNSATCSLLLCHTRPFTEVCQQLEVTGAASSALPVCLHSYAGSNATLSTSIAYHQKIIIFFLDNELRNTVLCSIHLLVHSHMCPQHRGKILKKFSQSICIWSRLQDLTRPSFRHYLQTHASDEGSCQGAVCAKAADRNKYPLLRR